MTGSASPSDPPTHSGAGRIVRVRLRPMTLAERGVAQPTASLARLLHGEQATIAGRSQMSLTDYVDEILRSGFPGFHDLSPRLARAQLDGYLERIVDRDFDALGHQVRRPATLRRWMQAYAAATATTASFETIRDAASGERGEKPTRATTQPYRDVLERLWILDPVPAWLPTPNRLARLSSPADTASPTRRSRTSFEVTPTPSSRTTRRPAHTSRRDALGRTVRIARHPLRPGLRTGRRGSASVICEPGAATARSISSSSAERNSWPSRSSSARSSTTETSVTFSGCATRSARTSPTP